MKAFMFLKITFFITSIFLFFTFSATAAEIKKVYGFVVEECSLSREAVLDKARAEAFKELDKSASEYELVAMWEETTFYMNTDEKTSSSKKATCKLHIGRAEATVVEKKLMDENWYFTHSGASCFVDDGTASDIFDTEKMWEKTLEEHIKKANWACNGQFREILSTERIGAYPQTFKNSNKHYYCYDLKTRFKCPKN